MVDNFDFDKSAGFSNSIALKIPNFPENREIWVQFAPNKPLFFEILCCDGIWQKRTVAHFRHVEGLLTRFDPGGRRNKCLSSQYLIR